MFYKIDNIYKFLLYNILGFVKIISLLSVPYEGHELANRIITNHFSFVFKDRSTMSSLFFPIPLIFVLLYLPFLHSLSSNILLQYFTLSPTSIIFLHCYSRQFIYYFSSSYSITMYVCNYSSFHCHL